MEYNKEKGEIILDKKLNELDKLVLDFINILKKHVDYVIISGYISILLGRSRATEDIDLFIKRMPFENLLILYEELKEKGFECLNTEKPDEIFSYLNSGLAVRFSRQGKPIPNFEIRFPKRIVDEETFSDSIIVKMLEGELKISSLERQIAFKRYYLKTDKDIEDALHIEEIFKNELDYNKINKLKKIVENIINKKNEN